MEMPLHCSSYVLRGAAIAAHSGHDVSYTAWGPFDGKAVTSLQSGRDTASRGLSESDDFSGEASFELQK
jgi:hypothetical protein